MTFITQTLSQVGDSLCQSAHNISAVARKVTPDRSGMWESKELCTHPLLLSRGGGCSWGAMGMALLPPACWHSGCGLHTGWQGGEGQGGTRAPILSRALQGTSRLCQGCCSPKRDGKSGAKGGFELAANACYKYTPCGTGNDLGCYSNIFHVSGLLQLGKLGHFRLLKNVAGS